MEVELLSTLDECQAIGRDWNEIALLNSAGPVGLGVTCSFDLSVTLWRTHLGGDPQRILVLKDNGRVMGILPCYSGRTRSFGITRRELGLIPELYPGRTGFLLREPSAECLAILLDAVYQAIAHWDVLFLTVVDGSYSASLLKEALARTNHPVEQTSATCCPYIELPSSWDEYLLARKRNFRQSVKRDRKKLAAQGAVEMKTYSREEKTGEFLDAMFRIEERSWKQTSGTSIIRNPRQERFHRAFTPVCARAGWLRCYVLYLDGGPIAYHYSTLYGNILYDFKSSYIENYKAVAPGKILRSMILAQLIDEGVEIVDFIGEVQPHKMDWTDKTYRLTRYAIFNNNIRGKVQHARIRATRALRGGNAAVDMP